MRQALLLILFTTVLSACQQAALRLNDIQFLGSHNSYKKAIDPDLLERLSETNPELAASLDYSHIALNEQLDLGLRKLELDVFADPTGGLFADPLGLKMIADPEDFDAVPLTQPGFKVMHVQDLDFRSQCALLSDCLAILSAWSNRHPDHFPIFITINAKDDIIEQPGFARPVPFDQAAFDQLDQALRAGLGEHLFVPDQLRRNFTTLPDALTKGWPVLDSLRGKFLVVLDETGAKLDDYVAGHFALAGRVMFVNAKVGQPEAAVRIINNPIADFDEIQMSVKQGYLVRTRADADTQEARSGSTKKLELALDSGAHIISTDYYIADPRFGTDYRVSLPQGAVARCNPVTTARKCLLYDVHDENRLSH